MAMQRCTVFPGDLGYPHLLLPLDDRPKKLYCAGAPVQENERLIAVIGTRSMTSYGHSATRSFVRSLVSVGFTIVSGLALGVDGEAHRAALDAGGRTIAVLPSGLRTVAPTEHQPLARDILRAGGALYTEYDDHAMVKKYHFHVRNRVIAGMCMGVLVIEAGERSGTAITVSHAGRYGKSVFAVPGPWTSEYSKGTKEMVNMGAKLVTSVDDILEEFHLDYKTGQRGTQQALLFESPTEESTYRTLEQYGVASMNLLLQRTQSSFSDVQIALTGLELRGLITRKFGEYILA